MGKTSAPYSQVVLLSMPSINQVSKSHAKPKAVSGLTVANHKEVDSKNSESFSDVVICVLEFSLHHSSVDFYQDNARQSGDEHPSDC